VEARERSRWLTGHYLSRGWRRSRRVRERESIGGRACLCSEQTVLGSNAMLIDTELRYFYFFGTRVQNLIRVNVMLKYAAIKLFREYDSPFANREK
jgi:hypothetical protein